MEVTNLANPSMRWDVRVSSPRQPTLVQACSGSLAPVQAVYLGSASSRDPMSHDGGADPYDNDSYVSKANTGLYSSLPKKNRVLLRCMMN
jgi:hypothetical protein